MGWHREQALISTTTPSYAAPFLLGGCCFRSCLRPERQSLGWLCLSMWAVVPPPPYGRCFSNFWHQATESFTSTASSLLPHNYLVGPYHEFAVLSWGVCLIIPLPPASRIAQPINVLGGAVIRRSITKGRGAGSFLDLSTD